MFQLHYTWSVADRNVVVWRVTVLLKSSCRLEHLKLHSGTFLFFSTFFVCQFWSHSFLGFPFHLLLGLLL